MITKINKTNRHFSVKIYQTGATVQDLILMGEGFDGVLSIAERTAMQRANITLEEYLGQNNTIIEK